MDKNGGLSLPLQTTVVIPGTAGCLYADEDLTITFPCAEYAGVQLGFSLHFYSNPEDLQGLYWKMDRSSVNGGSGTHCIPVGADLNIPVSCVEYAGGQYGFILRFFNNPNDPDGLYWKMDLNTL